MRKIYDLTIQTNHSFSISNKPQNATLLQTIKAFTQVAMYKSFNAERKSFFFLFSNDRRKLVHHCVETIVVCEHKSHFSHNYKKKTLEMLTWMFLGGRQTVPGTQRGSCLSPPRYHPATDACSHSYSKSAKQL